MLTIFLAYLIGLAGAIIHWGKKYSRQQTKDNLLDHFSKNVFNTLGALCTLAGAITLITSTGVDLTDTKDLSLLFLAGYGIDSSVNKNSDQ